MTQSKHPAAVLPRLSSEERDLLRADIEANGIRVPIDVDPEGFILDGLNRHEIASELGIECPHQTVPIASWPEKVAYALRVNVHRRQLSSEQWRAVRQQQRELAAQMRAEGMTQEQVAKTLGVALGTVKWWDAEDAGDTSKVGANDPCIRAVDTRVKIPKPEQERIAERLDAGETQAEIADDYKVSQQRISQIATKVKKVEESREAARTERRPGSIHLARSRWEDWIHDQPDCDLLLTDPPYATDVEDVQAFAAAWLPEVCKKVKPTGRAYVCIGAYPRELHAYLNIETDLELANILVWTYRNTLGPRPTHDYKLNWQAVLYLRGPEAEPLNCPEMVEQFAVQDINAPDGRQSDRYHAWQKPDLLAERFIRHSMTDPGVVLDPFAGTGTFLLAAARLGHDAYGCEPNPDTWGIAKDRGCA